MKSQYYGGNGNLMTMLYLTDDGKRAVELKRAECIRFSRDALMLENKVLIVLDQGDTVSVGRDEFNEIAKEWGWSENGSQRNPSHVGP